MRRLYRIEIAFIIVGLISLICYFIDSFLTTAILLLFGTAFLILFVPIFINQRKIGVYFGLAILTIIGIDQLVKSEILKGKILLSAKLKDDRSFLRIVLREGGKFEVFSSYMFGEDIYKGNYKLLGNKIIFLDKHYDNDFLPDTVFIIEDKIILKFDKNGQANTDFASFFQIESSELNSVP